MAIDAQQVRVFVGLELPPQVTQALAQLQAQLASIGLPLRFVRPESIHLTLAFIGEIPAPQVAGVIAAVQQAAAEVPRFNLRAEGVGAFPNARRPRALWA